MFFNPIRLLACIVVMAELLSAQFGPDRPPRSVTLRTIKSDVRHRLSR